MKVERKAEAFSMIEELYSRRRYIRGIRKFEKYKKINRGVQERDQKERDKISKKKKLKKTRREIKIELNLEVKELKKSKLPEKYIAKILFGQNNKKFENEYLKKLKRS